MFRPEEVREKALSRRIVLVLQCAPKQSNWKWSSKLLRGKSQLMCHHPPCKITLHHTPTCLSLPVEEFQCVFCLLSLGLHSAGLLGKKSSLWYSTNIVLSLFPFFSVLLTRGHNWCQPEAPAGSRAASEDNCYRKIWHSYEAGRPAPGGTVLQDLSSARLTWRGAEQVLGVPLQAGNRLCETQGKTKPSLCQQMLWKEILAVAC